MWKKAVYHTVALAIWLTLMLTGVTDRRFPQTVQGFICGDPSLTHNFKPNTFAWSTLNKINYAIPFCVMAVELVIHGRMSLNNLMITTVRCLKWVQQYFFIFILNYVTLQYIKSISGFLRPYFLTECMPDLAINCTKGEFVDSNYVCTNPNITNFVQRDFARSFPSLNTMIVVFPTVFIIWFLHQRITKIPLLFPIFATIGLAWSIYASITRITDHAHHPVDVVGAVILVIPFTLYLNYVGCKNFKVPSKLEKESLKNCLGMIECTSCNRKTNDKIQ